MPNNPNIIKDGAIINNDWLIVNDIDAPLPEGNLLVSLDIWETQKDTLSNRDMVGLWLKNDQCISEISEELTQFSVIAIDFPVFMDGRGFSIARLLRDRFGYKGEVRATGGIIRDQLCYLKRSGFNAFDMEAGIDLEASLQSLNDFTESYQTSADQATPLFRRRQA
jgi:uncharacterized protein (DUF934 family)